MPLKVFQNGRQNQQSRGDTAINIPTVGTTAHHSLSAMKLSDVT